MHLALSVPPVHLVPPACLVLLAVLVKSFVFVRLARLRSLQIFVTAMSCTFVGKSHLRVQNLIFRCSEEKTVVYGTVVSECATSPAYELVVGPTDMDFGSDVFKPAGEFLKREKLKRETETNVKLKLTSN